MRPTFQSKRRWLRRTVAGALLLGAVAAVVVYRLRPIRVVTTPVVRGTAVDAVYATCTVEAFDRATIKPLVSGSIDLKVRVGDRVAKGDLLAVIDSPALRFELERAKAEQTAAQQQAAPGSPQLAALDAQARSTEAQLKQAIADRDRVRRLVASGAAPQADVDAADSRVATLQAQLDALRAQRRSARIDLSARESGSRAAASGQSARLAEADVRSPLDGVVLARSVDPGEAVAAGQPLMRIGDVGNLVLECAVDEADIGRIAADAEAAVSLYAFAGRAFHGRVFDILPDADRTRKSFLVKLRLADAPPGMRSGMSAEVNLIVASHPNVLLAPSEAVDAASSVWIAEHGHARRRTVTTGIRDLLRVEILAGLAEGDQVVIAGAAGLTEGARVRASRQALDADPAPNAAAVVAGAK